MVDKKKIAHVSLRHRSIIFQVRFKTRVTVMESGRKTLKKEKHSEVGRLLAFPRSFVLNVF